MKRTLNCIWSTVKYVYSYVPSAGDKTKIETDVTHGLTDFDHHGNEPFRPLRLGAKVTS